MSNCSRESIRLSSLLATNKQIRIQRVNFLSYETGKLLICSQLYHHIKEAVLKSWVGAVALACLHSALSTKKVIATYYKDSGLLYWFWDETNKLLALNYHSRLGSYTSTTGSSLALSTNTDSTASLAETTNKGLVYK